MQITITINTDNAAFEEDPSVEVARILQRYAARLRENYPPLEDLNGDTLRDINGNTCGRVDVKPDPEPEMVRQTACRYCGLDIENMRPAPGKPYPRGQWRDRGNNSSCNDGKHRHAPVAE